MAETEVKSINGRPVADVTARAKIEEIKNAAPGLVFDTVADMEAYIAGNAGTLKVGQDLFIRAADVPDYWWDGTAAVPVETELGEVKRELAELSEAIDDLKQNGTGGTVTGGSVKTILANIMTIIKAQVNLDGTPQAYNPDISDIAKQTDTLIASLGTTEEEPEQPESGIVQTGSVLAITSGVATTQTGSVLAIA